MGQYLDWCGVNDETEAKEEEEEDRQLPNH